MVGLSRPSALRVWMVACIAALGISACDSPPVKELEAAEAELAKARDADAEVFASEAFSEAETALTDARANVLRREYRSALSSALDAAQKSKEARGVAAVAKDAVRKRSDALVASARERIAQAASSGEAKGRKAAPTPECRNAVDRAQPLVETLASHAADGDWVAAREDVTATEGALDQIDKACAVPSRSKTATKPRR